MQTPPVTAFVDLTDRVVKN